VVFRSSPSPTNTPVRGSPPAAGRPAPASSSAAAAVWSIRSCCGSISSSSFGGMRNRSSGTVRRSTKYPGGQSRSAWPQPFRFGAGAGRSPPPRTCSWNLRRSSHGPKWVAIPTTATGSGGGSDNPSPVATAFRGNGVKSSVWPTNSSSKRWAFTPPNPNPLTAARRGSPGRGFSHGSASRSTRNGPPSYFKPGPGARKFACGGRTLLANARSTLATAAAPAPVRRCPTVDFTDPIVHCPGTQPSAPHSSRRLSNSTASPTGVPVAWHSIRSTSAGRHPACVYAARIARSCPSRSGASRFPRMSLDSPAPAMTA
jgi:hypothetical protein